MTAKELIAAIEFFKDLATNLTVKLALACGVCDDCGYCEGEECWDDENGCPDDCAHCKTPCHGVEIPACLLEDAGIDPEVGLQFDTRDGEIIIREIDEDWDGDGDDADPVEDLPVGLLEVLAQSDICIQSLRELLASGEVVYG